MNSRIDYVDYIKGIMIFLMVMYHINYVSAIKPSMSLVYSFHMPIFLFFSGYFIKTNKPIRDRFYNVLRSLVIPFFIFETVYILSIYIAGRLGFSFQNSIPSINFRFILYKILAAPIGAYWYLHTLIICMIIVYLVDYYVKNLINSILIIGLVLFVMCQGIAGLKFENCLFFLVGYYFQKFKIDIPIALASIIPFALIAFLHFETLKRGTIESLSLVLFSISFLGWLFKKTSSLSVTRIMSHLGRNTLIIVLLHPIFLNLFKVTFKWFLILDSSGLLFSIVATTVTITLSLSSSVIMDKLGLSNMIFGKKIYVPFVSN